MNTASAYTPDLETITRELADCPLYEQATCRLHPFRRSYLNCVLPRLIFQTLRSKERLQRPNPLKKRLAHLQNDLSHLQWLAERHPVLQYQVLLFEAQTHVIRGHYQTQANAIRKQWWKDLFIVRLDRFLRPIPASPRARQAYQDYATRNGEKISKQGFRKWLKRTGVESRLPVIAALLQAFHMTRSDGIGEEVNIKQRLARLRRLDTRVKTIDFTQLNARGRPKIFVSRPRALEDHLCDELRTSLEAIYRDERLQGEGVPATELWRSRINILEINRILTPHKLTHLTNDLIATL